jgi:hypothetical protein
MHPITNFKRASSSAEVKRGFMGQLSPVLGLFLLLQCLRLGQNLVMCLGMPHLLGMQGVGTQAFPSLLGLGIHNGTYRHSHNLLKVLLK